MQNDDLLEIHREFRSTGNGTKLRIVEDYSLNVFTQVENNGKWSTLDPAGAKALARDDTLTWLFLAEHTELLK